MEMRVKLTHNSPQDHECNVNEKKERKKGIEHNMKSSPNAVPQELFNRKKKKKKKKKKK